MKKNKSRKIYYFCAHEQFQPEIILEHAVLAERAGFDGVFASEHFNPWVADVGSAGFTFSTLGAIAAVTKKIDLMTGVVTPLFRYHPAVIAQAAATIDRLTQGRFKLGIGTGETINELPLGLKFPPYKERAERVREAIYIMRKLLDGKKITYKGMYYEVNGAKLYSPPVGKVPIYLAAAGPKSGRIAGELAEGIIMSVKDVDIARNQIHVKAIKAAKIRHRKLNTLVTKWIIFAKSKKEAWQVLKPWRGLRSPYRHTASDPLELQIAADRMERDEIMNKFTIVSSFERYIDIYRQMIEVFDPEIIVLQTTSIDQKKLIYELGKRVLPALRS